MVLVTLFNVIIFFIELNLFIIKVKCVRVLRNCFRVGNNGKVFGNISGWRINIRRLSGSSRRDCCSRSITWIISSKFFALLSSVIISRVCWFRFSNWRIFFFGALRSICLISWRDVIMLLTVRWLRLSIRLIIRRFCGLKICWLLWFISMDAVSAFSFVFFFCSLSRRIIVSVVRWRSVWLAERKRRRLKIVNWLSVSIIIEKLMVAYR